MIEEFVKAWEEKKHLLREQYAKKRPDNYMNIVRNVIELLHDEGAYSSPDPKRITEIDHGCYQGTLVFVIAASGYQPDDYWYVRVYYGSCSGCDTLQAIQGWDDEIDEKEINGYMTLSLHIVQRLKKMDDEDT